MNRLTTTRQTKTIAVVSGKGGVGKSNFTLNFALSLAGQGKAVLIVDLDIGMGNIDILLGLQANTTIVEMFDKQLPIHDIIEHGPHSINYIAAGSGLSDLFSLDEAKFNYFIDQFETVSSEYDYVFFDMGAGATDESLLFILAADECIVVTTPEPTAMMDAYGMMKHIHQRNASLPFYLLVNRVENAKEGQQIIQRLQKVSERFLAKTLHVLGMIPFDKKVSRAVIKQIPFSMFDTRSPATRAINQIAMKYVSNQTDKNDNDKSPSSFITKLKRLLKER